MANLSIKTSAFFNKPGSGLSSIAQLAANSDIIFSGRNQQVDIDYWSDLQDAGFDNNTNLGWYFKSDNGPDPEAIYRPGSPSASAQPPRNSIAFEELGDMDKVLNNILAPDSSTWPLRFLNSNPSHNPPYSAGDAVFSQSSNVNPFIHMDTSVQSYRDHFKQRFETYFYGLAVEDRPGFLWGDNGRDNPMFTGTVIIPTEQYPLADGSDWFAANLDWIQWLIDNVCIPNGVGLCINYQTTGSAITRFKQYIDVMSTLVDAGLQARTFIEFFASTSSGAYEGTLNLWKKSIEKMAYAESRGVITDCCVQLQGDLVQNESNSSINERARFTLASFLLAMGSRSTLRYSDDDNVNGVGYGYFNIPPLFAEYASIRQPTGPYYSPSTGVYRRNFVDGGYVIVDYSVPSAPTYQIVPGVGSTKKPLVTQWATDLTGMVTESKLWKVFAEAQDGGVLSYALQSGSLPTGKTLNSSTGELTGTYSAAGTFSGVIRVSETGGGFADVPYTFTIQPAPPVPTDNYLVGINFGGTQQTMANGDVFEAATAAIMGSGTEVGYAGILNGATDGSSAAGITRHASVPTHWTDAMFKDWLNDTTNDGPVVTISTSLHCDIRVGFLSGSTPAGRIVDILINGSGTPAATVNFADFAANVAFVVTIEDVAPSGGEITVKFNRNASATVSSRVMLMDFVELDPVIDPPVLAPIGDKTADEAVAPASFDISATADTGIAVLDATAPDGGVFDQGATFVDNGDGTGTFSLGSQIVSGEYEVTFTAYDPTDGTKTDSETITITVSDSELPAVDRFTIPDPPLGEQTVTEITLTEGETISVKVYVTNPFGMSIIETYPIDPTPPSGLDAFVLHNFHGDLDPDPFDTVGFFPQVGDAGTYTMTYTLSSAYGDPQTGVLSIVVEALPPEPVDTNLILGLPRSRQRDRVRG